MMAEDSFERIVISHLHSLAQQLANPGEALIDRNLTTRTGTRQELDQDVVPPPPDAACDQLHIDLSEMAPVTQGEAVMILTFGD
jgi:hypothetical protein